MILPWELNSGEELSFPIPCQQMALTTIGEQVLLQTYIILTYSCDHIHDTRDNYMCIHAVHISSNATVNYGTCTCCYKCSFFVTESCVGTDQQIQVLCEQHRGMSSSSKQQVTGVEVNNKSLEQNEYLYHYTQAVINITLRQYTVYAVQQQGMFFHNYCTLEINLLFVFIPKRE